MATRIQVVIDCADPDGLATFWAEALGYTKQDPPEGYATWWDFETAQGVPLRSDVARQEVGRLPCRPRRPANEARVALDGPHPPAELVAIAPARAL